jgi:hypothetical protein
MNEQKAINILTWYGYNTTLDEQNYSEIKNAVIQTLDLASREEYDEAIRRAQVFDENVRNDVLSEIAEMQKG